MKGVIAVNGLKRSQRGYALAPLVQSGVVTYYRFCPTISPANFSETPQITIFPCTDGMGFKPVKFKNDPEKMDSRFDFV
jgi:hypothetical protein